MARKTTLAKLAKQLKIADGWVWAAVMALAFLLVEARLIPETSVGYGLSDELLAVATRGGVVSSPGYPLTSLLLWGLGQVFKGASVIRAGHWMAAIMASGSVGVTFISLWKLYGQWRKKDQRAYVWLSPEWERWALGVVATSSFFGSQLLIRYGQIAERHSVNWVLATILMWLMVSIVEKGKKEGQRRWWLVAGIWGLGISQAWWFWLILPTLAWLGYEKKIYREPKLLSQMTGSALLAVGLPYLVMYSAFSQTVEGGYYWGESLPEFFAFIGKGYLGGEWARSNDLENLVSGLNLNTLLVGSWRLVRWLLAGVGWWLWLPWLFVAVFAYQGKKGFGWWLVWSLLTPLLLGMVAVWPVGEVRYSDAWILGETSVLLLFLPWLAWIGWWEMLKRLGAGFSVLFSPKRVTAGLGAAMVVGSGLSWASAARMVKPQAENSAVNRTATTILRTAEPESLILCFSPRMCRALALTAVFEEKDGLEILPAYAVGERMAGNTGGLSRFEYPSEEERIFDLVSWTLGKRPIYTVDLPNEYMKGLGIEFGFTNYIPLGYTGKLVRGLPEMLPDEFEYGVSEELLAEPARNWDGEGLELRSETASRHILNATVLMQAGMREAAVRDVNIASSLLKAIVGKEEDNIESGREGLERIEANQYFRPGYTPPSTEEIVSAGRQVWNEGARGRAIEVFRGAVMLQPSLVETRMIWADALAEVMASRSALLEYRHIQELDPANEEAAGKIAKLERLLEKEGNSP